MKELLFCFVFVFDIYIAMMEHHFALNSGCKILLNEVNFLEPANITTFSFTKTNSVSVYTVDSTGFTQRCREVRMIPVGFKF